MRQRITEWVRRHPLEAFFLFGFAATYALLFPAILIFGKEAGWSQYLGFYLGRMGTYVPVLAGMWVASLVRPDRARVSLGRRLSVFLPVLFVAAIVHTVSLSLDVPPGTPPVALFIISLPVALLPAWVVTAAVSGADGVRRLLKTLIKPSGNFLYYIFAFLAFPVINLTGLVITNLLNGNPLIPRVSNGAELGFAFIITFFSVLLFSGGINEEAGWRGFAQNRMQVRYSPLAANLILWVLLVIWHIPNDIVQYANSGYVLVRFVLYPFITILFGWVYNRTGGSILTPAIFHASMNGLNPLVGVVPMTTAGNVILIGVTLIAIASDRMWRRLPADHPAVYQDAPTSPA
jgi:membrane protease YdiL (CAAX protease family)